MEQDFAGKIALITGSSGMGLASALRIAAGGGRVHLCGIDDELNTEAARRAGSMAIAVHKVDVSDEQQVAAVVEKVAGLEGGLDIVVNAAAIQTYGDVETTDSAHWDRVMNVNVKSCYLTSHYAVPHMKKRGGGAIVHLSSVQGHANQYDVLAYATSKGAIHALTRAMAVDCAKHNIRVNSVSPGAVRTPLLEVSARRSLGDGRTLDEIMDSFGQSHPIGRIGRPEEIAELIAFLCSERASFCTASDFVADGGLKSLIGG
ncbi:MAG: SDR family oxidoreductase [Rhodospirillales bacterium]|nr:SDR family oxidoreductase [Rhodospirillales bacterium]